MRMFSSNEREFVRLCGMARPDWAAMKQLGVEAMEWENGWYWSCLSQLNGVYSWRLVSPELDGTVPENVRKLHAMRMGHLDKVNLPWLEDVTGFLDELKKAGVPHVVSGGPSQYAPLGMDHWMRTWNELDVQLPDEFSRDLRKITESAGAVVGIEYPGVVCGTVNGRTTMTVQAHPERAVLPWDLHTWNLFERTRTVEAFGYSWPRMALELEVFVGAAATWWAFASGRHPLPLWALARLANWAGEPGFDSARLLAMLDADEAAWKKTQVRFTSTADIQDYQDASGTNSQAAVARWVLALAKEVCGLPFEVAPSDPALLPRRDRGPDSPNLDPAGTEYHLCRWGRRPEAETLLFDFPSGYEARIAAGWWEELAPSAGSGVCRKFDGTAAKILTAVAEAF